MSEPHLPVLKAEVLTLLNLKPNQFVIDCTVGAGGHADSILQQTAPDGQLLGLDIDPDALKIAASRLQPYETRVRLVNANFDQLTQIAAVHSFSPVQAILADLGVSSMQLDQPERGFSFTHDGPLDMRLGPTVERSAADLINTLKESDLADLIYRYGEERRSRRIARAIVQARPIQTTGALAEIISKAVGGRRGRKTHPATRTFQALRIAVNDELGALERFLPQALELLAPGGRLAVISFHSLEDRIVKRFFRQRAIRSSGPVNQQDRPIINIITKKPVVAAAQEISLNPRARSAKLRVAEIKGNP